MINSIGDLYNFFSLGHLFKDEAYIIAACTHPHFKVNWLDSRTEKEDAIDKIKLLLNDPTTPVTENKDEAVEDFVSFPPTKPSKPNEVDFLYDRSRLIN